MESAGYLCLSKEEFYNDLNTMKEISSLIGSQYQKYN